MTQNNDISSLKQAKAKIFLTKNNYKKYFMKEKPTNSLPKMNKSNPKIQRRL